MTFSLVAQENISISQDGRSLYEDLPLKVGVVLFFVALLSAAVAAVLSAGLTV